MASWELRVEGKLLEDVRLRAGMDGLGEKWGMQPPGCWRCVWAGVRLSLSRSVLQPSKQKRKFSSFFKSLVIELDKELYGPDNHLVEVRRELPALDLHPGQGGKSPYPWVMGIRLPGL